jgi:hypothetical protein
MILSVNSHWSLVTIFPLIVKYTYCRPYNSLSFEGNPNVPYKFS